VEAKVERLVVKPKSGKVALEWGKNAPGMEDEENEDDRRDDGEGSDGDELGGTDDERVRVFDY
jgi:hypothetical protein